MQRRYITILIQSLVFLNIFNICIVFRERAYGSDSVDFQILIKLGVWAGTFCVCLLFAKVWAGRMFRPDNIFLLPLLGLIVISCLYAPSPAYSFGAALSLISVIALFYTASALLERQDILLALIWGVTLISFLSLIAYFAFPQVGRGLEWQGGRQVLSHRLSGVTGTPNAIGLYASFALMVAFFYRQSNNGRVGAFVLAFSAINFLALALSDSRTSVAILVLSLAAAFFSVPTPRRVAVLCFGIAAVALGALVIDPESIMEALSRSGDAEEITTGTGRVYIWATVLELIQQKPWTGWGFASSSFVLPNYAKVIGHTPSHAHNMWLQLVFSVGYGGLFLFGSLVIIKLVMAVRTGDRFLLSLLVFLLLGGLTEPSVFKGVASMATVVFALIMAIDYKPLRPRP